MIKGERLEEGKNKGQRKGEVDETDRDREVHFLFSLVHTLLLYFAISHSPLA